MLVHRSMAPVRRDDTRKEKKDREYDSAYCIWCGEVTVPGTIIWYQYGTQIVHSSTAPVRRDDTRMEK